MGAGFGPAECCHQFHEDRHHNLCKWRVCRSHGSGGGVAIRWSTAGLKDGLADDIGEEVHTDAADAAGADTAGSVGAQVDADDKSLAGMQNKKERVEIANFFATCSTAAFGGWWHWY